MIRKNLLKAATLGLCMSALITGASKTGIAFANELERAHYLLMVELLYL